MRLERVPVNKVTYGGRGMVAIYLMTKQKVHQIDRTVREYPRYSQGAQRRKLGHELQPSTLHGQCLSAIDQQQEQKGPLKNKRDPWGTRSKWPLEVAHVRSSIYPFISIFVLSFASVGSFIVSDFVSSLNCCLSWLLRDRPFVCCLCVHVARMCAVDVQGGLS